MPRPTQKKLLGALAPVLGALAALTGCHTSQSTCETSDDAAGLASAPVQVVPRHVNLLVGTYTEGPASSGKSKGIPVFRFDTATGEARQVSLASGEGVRNPSWLAISPSGQHVYAVNELNGTGKSGEVSAFDFDPKTGKLSFINKVSSEGDDPCHLMLDERHGRLFVSNYSAGGMVAIPVNLSGKLSPSLATSGELRVLPSAGSHIHSTAQAVPRQATPSPTGGTHESFEHSDVEYWVQDLGTDSIHMLYQEGEYFSRKNSVKKLPSGTGPRHLIFDTSGTHAYVIGELNDSVTVLSNTPSYAEPSGLNAAPWQPAQTVTLGAPVEPGKGTAAAIHLSEDGKFLYASTRNPKNILVVFAVNPTDGTLREIQTVSSGGKAPREFAIAPGGKFLLVANQQSDAIAVFSRDSETGKIADTGRRIPVGTPVDLKWAPAE